MTITEHDIRSLDDIAIINELIEAYVFKGERASDDITKRELVRRDGKIINPRNFCDDEEMVGKLMFSWARKAHTFSIKHDIFSDIPFTVKSSKGFTHSAHHLGRALCKVILMELLVDGK
jgi:hypothetical protein